MAHTEDATARKLWDEFIQLDLQIAVLADAEDAYRTKRGRLVAAAALDRAEAGQQKVRLEIAKMEGSGAVTTAVKFALFLDGAFVMIDETPQWDGQTVEDIEDGESLDEIDRQAVLSLYREAVRAAGYYPLAELRRAREAAKAI
jgi:hypothetical protein